MRHEAIHPIGRKRTVKYTSIEKCSRELPSVTTTAQEIENIVCQRCFALLDVQDNFCRHCGLPMKGGVAGGYAPPVKSDRPGWSENPWVVLASLFLVFGPLGLPMLWRSRRFSLLWKIILTVVVLVLTVLIFVLIWYVVDQALAPLKELRGMQGF